MYLGVWAKGKDDYDDVENVAKLLTHFVLQKRQTESLPG